MGWMAAAALGASALGFLGQKSANSANAAMSREQIEFQRDSRDRAHQIEVADMRAAGLNPVLSAGGSGAGIPSGSTYNHQNEAASARDAALAIAQIDNMKAQTKKTNADARLATVEADKAEITKAPYTAIQGALPKIKSTARDMADFYTGDREGSPRDVYNMLKSAVGQRVSSSRGVAMPDTKAIADLLRNNGLKPIEVRPLPRSSKR